MVSSRVKYFLITVHDLEELVDWGDRIQVVAVQVCHDGVPDPLVGDHVLVKSCPLLADFLLQLELLQLYTPNIVLMDLVISFHFILILSD